MIRYLITLFFIVYSCAAKDIDNAFAYCKDVVETSSFANVSATGSMKPTFDENYILLLQKVPFETLKVGDIITFSAVTKIKDGARIEYVVHRIVGKSSEGNIVITKGDNNPQCDDLYITRDNFDKLVVGFIRKDAPNPYKIKR